MWHRSHTSWSDAQLRLLATRLQSSSVDGLSLNPVRGHYMVKYKNALVGKHFKSLQQVTIFHLHGDLYDKLTVDLWNATGKLGAMLWYDTIRDMDGYLVSRVLTMHAIVRLLTLGVVAVASQADLQILIDNLLDIWALIDPRRIIEKAKLHTLTHLPNDIRQHGPSILYSTEIFECWNAVFRLCSVLSNHQAPSRDIAETLAHLERFKHHVSGGWWKNEHGDYVQAGDGVRSFLKSEPNLQRRLGWVPKSAKKPGMCLLHVQTALSCTLTRRDRVRQAGVPYEAF